MNVSETQTRSGLPHAIFAYTVWGLLPLYLMFLRHVPAFEFIGWRIIFTAPVCLIVIAARRQWLALRAAIGNPRTLFMLLATAILIGSNWLVYVTAVQEGHVLAASLGYYINPLVNVLAGTLFLGERLSRRAWIAVTLAAIGVAMLAWGALDMLGISLFLATTFCAYGLLRKLTPVDALPGLTIESMWLMLPAFGLVAWHAMSPAGTAIGKDIGTDLLIAGAGVITAVPLLLFTVAARRMDFSTLGFIQYLAPTIAFLLALFVFGEPLQPVQLASFVTIWVAIAIFTWDLVARHRALASRTNRLQRSGET